MKSLTPMIQTLRLDFWCFMTKFIFLIILITGCSSIGQKKVKEIINPVNEESALQIRAFQIMNGDVPDPAKDFLICKGEYIQFVEKIEYVDYYRVLTTDQRWLWLYKWNCQSF